MGIIRFGSFATRRTARGRATVVAMLVAFLWMQLAVAAYACPALVGDGETSAAQAHDCGSTISAGATVIPDTDNPTLCLQHALRGDQGVDSGPATPPAAPTAMMIGTAPTAASPHIATLVVARSHVLLRATAPPKAIAHCCFRI
jgi:hypothetical protein